MRPLVLPETRETCGAGIRGPYLWAESARARSSVVGRVCWRRGRAFPGVVRQHRPPGDMFCGLGPFGGESFRGDLSAGAAHLFYTLLCCCLWSCAVLQHPRLFTVALFCSLREVRPLSPRACLALLAIQNDCSVRIGSVRASWLRERSDSTIGIAVVPAGRDIRAQRTGLATGFDVRFGWSQGESRDVCRCYGITLGDDFLEAIAQLLVPAGLVLELVPDLKA